MKRALSTSKGSQSRSKWNEKEKRTQLMSFLTKELNIKSMEDWYRVSQKEIAKHAGWGLLEQFHNSPAHLIMSAFPGYEWHPWKFSKAPIGFWNDKENQLKYMKWLSKELNIKTMEEWYFVSCKVQVPFYKYSNKPKEYGDNYGGGLLHILYHNSPYRLLSSVYPEYEWLPWRFNHVPRGFWERKENQLKYMTWLGKQLNIQSMEDWYRLSNKTRISSSTTEKGFYTNTIVPPSLLLRSVFPEYSWDIFKFDKVPQRLVQKLSEDESVQKEFIESLAKRFDIQKTEDWYHIRAEQVDEVISITFGEVVSMVRKFYPDLKLELFERTPNNTKKSQYALKLVLEELFPGNEILEEYRHPDMDNLELDIFLPNLKIAFEYQGKQHYEDVNFFRPQNYSKQKDEKKVLKCKEHGITLISVPYWWNKQSSSLKATIYNIRPDVIEVPPNESVEAIPLTPPVTESRKAKRNEIQSELMLATNWNPEDDPTGWWMSEKYDGIRAFWSGRKMYSRSGREIKIPDFFRVRLPPLALDGELWIQRGNQQESLQLTQRMSEKLWEKAVYCIFDVPDLTDDYEDRVKFVKKFAEENEWPSYLKVVEPVKCEGRDHLQRYYQEILSKLGEGVILRQAESKYEKGRSKMMRRYKEYQDTEVKVIKNMYPHGFQCQQTNGQELFVGINVLDSENAKKVKEDEIITVKYSGVNIHGKLIQPTFFRTRGNEMTWEQLKRNTL